MRAIHLVPTWSDAMTLHKRLTKDGARVVVFCNDNMSAMDLFNARDYDQIITCYSHTREQWRCECDVVVHYCQYDYTVEAKQVRVCNERCRPARQLYGML